MPEYIFKTYILGGREYFVYGEKRDPFHRRNEIIEKDFPFLESLLELVYLDIWKYEPLFKKMERVIREIYQKDDYCYQAQLSDLLDELAQIHIFFHQTRLDWQSRIDLIDTPEVGSLSDLLPIKKLTHIPATIDAMQWQIKGIFEQVLDIDKGTDPVQKRMTRFLRNEKDASRHTFEFASSLPLHFEATGNGTFGEVLYPRDVYDLIEYSLREAIKREQRMRICKNCGRYFAIARRSTAEYCERPIDARGRTCKDVGSIVQWTKNRADDDIFKAYRREYKRRFAWIKAGRVTAEEFYAWSEKAREKKAECDEGRITLGEFEGWLRDS